MFDALDGDRRQVREAAHVTTSERECPCRPNLLITADEYTIPSLTAMVLVFRSGLRRSYVLSL